MSVHAIINFARRLRPLGRTNAYDAAGAADAMREGPAGQPADAAAAKQPRLTLRRLHGLIETLKEDQRKLELRVDKLTRMLDRTIVMDHEGRLTAAETAAAAETGVCPDGGLADNSGPGREDRRGGGTDSRMNGGQHGGPGLRRNGESAVVPITRREAEFSADPPGLADPNIQLTRAPDRENIAAFGIAIWAGVERAIGNAAAALATEREADRLTAVRLNGSRSNAAAAGSARPGDWRTDGRTAAEGLLTASDSGKRTSPDAEEPPVDSMLLELREAARIAEEIALHASEQRLHAPSRPRQSPATIRDAVSDASGDPFPAASSPLPEQTSESMAGVDPSPADAAASPAEFAGQATGTAPATAESPPSPNEAARGIASSSASDAGPDTAVDNAAGSDRPNAVIDNAAKTDRPAAAPGARIGLSPTLPSPAADQSPPYFMPRAERHRSRKKRSLWARLFNRRHAWS